MIKFLLSIKKVLPVLFIIFLGLVFFFDVLFLDYVLFAGDNLTINMPSKILFLKMLQQSELPLWNPYIFSGTPLLADINLGLLSPFNMFYLAFAPLKAISFAIVTAVICSGITMYWYCRTIKLTSIASVLAGVIYMFSGSIMTHTMNTAILNTIVWIPLLFVFIEYLYTSKKIIYALFASIILSMSLFGGHIQYFYYTVLFSFFYMISKKANTARKIGYITVIYIPMLFLTAVQTLPFLEYARFSTRPVRDLGYAGSVSAISFIRLILPNFFGVMRKGTSWGATADINGYMGIIPLILSSLAMLRMKNRNVIFFGLAALISLLLALGKYSPIYLTAFYVLPFISRFRSPGAVLIVYTFCLAVLSGFGYENIVAKYDNKKSFTEKKFALFGFLLLVFFCVILYIKIYGFFWFQDFMTACDNILHATFTSRFLEYSASRMMIIFHLWTMNVLTVFLTIFLFIVWLFLFQKYPRFRYHLKFFFLFLVITELMFFAYNNYIVSKKTVLETRSPIEKFLKKDAYHYRILTYTDPGAKPPFGDPGYFEYEAIKALDFFQPNTNIPAQLQSVGGYASIVHKEYADFFPKSNTNIPTEISLPEPGIRELDHLNVKYILTSGRYKKELEKNSDYIAAFSYFDSRINRNFWVFQNKQVYPRAYVADLNHNFVNKADIISYTSNNIQILATSTSSAYLVLLDMYYPGWTVSVNNVKSQLNKHLIFRSVHIPKGTSNIIFSYEPKIFFLGAMTSIMAWPTILGLMFFLLVKDHKYIGHKLHVGKSRIKNNS